MHSAPIVLLSSRYGAEIANISTERWRENSPEVCFSSRWVDEFESIKTQNAAQKNYELAAFTEEEIAVRAEINTLLHYRLQLLRCKFDAIASERRTDHRRKLEQHFSNAAQYMVS